MNGYKFRAHKRCERTGCRIYSESIYRDGRWIALHVTLSAPAVDVPLRPVASEPDWTSCRPPRRIAQ